ncbi:hypothetical protein JCM13664_13040 [Methylothermus subterraneus]
MKMKKLALSTAIAAAMGTTAVQAVVESEYSVGLLVPNVIHDGKGNTTAVGLIARRPGVIYWTFFDQNSKHVTDGQIKVTENDYVSFVWQDEGGFGTENQRGYLVFVEDVDPDGAGPNVPDGVINVSDFQKAPLAGHAVQVIPPNDVAFLPSVPLTDIDFEGDLGTAIDPTNLTATSVDYLMAGANCVSNGATSNGQIGTLTETISGPLQEEIDMRYFIDGKSGGRDTSILAWSASAIKGTYTVNMFDDQQNRKSVNFELPNEEQNFIDVEKIVGRPANFLDGFIRWPVPCGFVDDQHKSAAPWNGVVTFSTISAPDFGAVQTIINPWGNNVTPEAGEQTIAIE